MFTLTYSSNNSGGSWWLKDEDWYAMEKAGWKVDWIKDEPDSIFRDKDGTRFLGALAKNASIQTDDPKQAIREWEALTGQNAADEGCNCCGEPHYFSWEDENGNYETIEIRRSASWD